MNTTGRKTPREKVFEDLCAALEKAIQENASQDYDNFSLKNAREVSKAIEIALTDEYGDATKEYKAKYRTVLFNLKNPDHPQLRASVLAGKIAPEKLVRMSPNELASPQLQAANEKTKEEYTRRITFTAETAALFSTEAARQSKDKTIIIGKTNVTKDDFPEYHPMEKEKSDGEDTAISEKVRELFDQDSEQRENAYRFPGASSPGPSSPRVLPLSIMLADKVQVEEQVEELYEKSDNKKDSAKPKKPKNDKNDIQTTVPNAMQCEDMPWTLPKKFKKDGSVWNGYFESPDCNKRCQGKARYISGQINLTTFIEGDFTIMGRVPIHHVAKYLKELISRDKKVAFGLLESNSADASAFKSTSTFYSNKDRAGYWKKENHAKKVEREMYLIPSSWLASEILDCNKVPPQQDSMVIAAIDHTSLLDKIEVKTNNTFSSSSMDVAGQVKQFEENFHNEYSRALQSSTSLDQTSSLSQPELRKTQSDYRYQVQARQDNYQHNYKNKETDQYNRDGQYSRDGQYRRDSQYSGDVQYNRDSQYDRGYDPYSHENQQRYDGSAYHAETTNNYSAHNSYSQYNAQGYDNNYYYNNYNSYNNNSADYNTYSHNNNAYSQDHYQYTKYNSAEYGWGRLENGSKHHSRDSDSRSRKRRKSGSSSRHHRG